MSKFKQRQSWNWAVDEDNGTIIITETTQGSTQESFTFLIDDVMDPAVNDNLRRCSEWMEEKPETISSACNKFRAMALDLKKKKDQADASKK